MTKDYYVEVKLNSKRWTLISTYKRHKDALDYVASRKPDKYPLRIVRITRTVVFEGNL
jgi:hypothetical protein